MPDFITGPIGKVLGGALLLIALYGGFRLWLSSHDASILSGYVLLSEKTTAEAKATEMERQRNEAQQATNDYRKRLDAAQTAQAAATANLETEIRSYELQLSEKNRQCLADSADVEWLLRH